MLFYLRFFNLLCCFSFILSSRLLGIVLDENSNLDFLKRKQLGYYLGSFDPIHLGHETFMQRSLELGYVDYILIYPAPGGDSLKNRTDVAIRQDMLYSLFENDPKIIVTKKSPQELQNILKGAPRSMDIVAMIGVDLIENKTVEQLFGNKVDEYMSGKPLTPDHYNDTYGSAVALKAHLFLIGLRGDLPKERMPQHVYGREVLAYILSSDDSSTRVRSAIANKKEYSYYLSDKISQTIAERSLYLKTSK